MKKYTYIKLNPPGGPFTKEARLNFLANRPGPLPKARHGQRGSASARALIRYFGKADAA